MKRKILVLFLVIILLAILLYFSLGKRVLVKEMKVETKDFLIFIERRTIYPTRISIVENLTKLGVSTDIDKIDFGIVPKGSRVRKEITLYNNNTIKVKVYVRVYGNITDFIEVENKFVLNPNETKKLPVIITSKYPGNYSGEIEIIIRKPKTEAILWLI